MQPNHIFRELHWSSKPRNTMGILLVLETASIYDQKGHETYQGVANELPNKLQSNRYMLSTCLNSENKHIVDIKLDHMMTTTNVWCSMDQCKWALYNHKTGEILGMNHSRKNPSVCRIIWPAFRLGMNHSTYVVPLKCFLSFLFFFLQIFLIFFKFWNLLFKKKKKSQNSVISASLTVKANWVLMEYYIDKN